MYRASSSESEMASAGMSRKEAGDAAFGRTCEEDAALARLYSPENLAGFGAGLGGGFDLTGDDPGRPSLAALGKSGTSSCAGS